MTDDQRPKSQGEKALDILREWKQADDDLRAIENCGRIDAYDAVYERITDIERRRDDLLREG